MDAQNKSLRYVQLYAVKDRVNLSQLSQTPPSEVALDMILPSDEDNASLMENMSILIARVMVNRIPFFKERILRNLSQIIFSTNILKKCAINLKW